MRTKRAKKVRQSSEFSLFDLAKATKPPRRSSAIHAWDEDSIRQARNAQMAGQFRLAARLAEATRTDYAIFAAFLNRLAPQHGLPVSLVPKGSGAIAKRIAAEADALFGKAGVGVSADTMSDIDGCLANHGVAFAHNTITPRADGSRVDFQHSVWPIDSVRWDASRETFIAMTADQGDVEICHGDGRWTIYRQHELEPWKHGAILPLAAVWSSHAFGIRDRGNASVSHGNAKVVGTLPQGIALQDGEGLTPEASAFLEMLSDIASVEAPYGIKPAGSMIDYITNNSNAWQIFKEIIESGDKAADRIYLGRDSTVQGLGGDAVSYLFSVRTDIVEGSLRAIQRGFQEGVLDPWTALNFGDSRLAPAREYLIPDADENARVEGLAKRTAAFGEAVKESRANGFVVDQAFIDELAEQHGVIAPTLAESAPTHTEFSAYEVDGGVFTINELRAGKGLPEVSWGNVTVPERRQQLEQAKASTPDDSSE